MGRMPPLVNLWPGLPQLWLRGSWSGLALAAGFSALVNFLLAATFVWTAWLSTGLLLVGWGVVAILWCASAWGTRTSHAETTPASVPVADPATGCDLLADVYAQYLQGNWFEAETALGQMLRQRPRDAEALLMLATLQRHTERLDEAGETLDRLERLDESTRWQMEISAERGLIERSRSELDELEPPEQTPADAAEEELSEHAETSEHEEHSEAA